MWGCECEKRSGGLLNVPDGELFSAEGSDVVLDDDDGDILEQSLHSALGEVRGL
jgi:hypothetical protein